MNRISLRIVSLTALAVSAFVVAQGCASEQTSFNGLNLGSDSGVPQGSGGQFGGNGGAFPGNGGTVTGNGGTVTGNGGAFPGNGGTVTGNGGTSPGGTANGGSGGTNSCKPSFCPASGSGSPCCTSSGSCGVDFGMGCTAPPRDGGTP